MKQILVVDDEPDARAWLELVLKRHGYHPYLAGDGTAALELLQANRIDLILADVAMPGLNGYQLCQLVKTSDRPDWALISPIIFYST